MTRSPEPYIIKDIRNILLYRILFSSVLDTGLGFPQSYESGTKLTCSRLHVSDATIIGFSIKKGRFPFFSRALVFQSSERKLKHKFVKDLSVS